MSWFSTQNDDFDGWFDAYPDQPDHLRSTEWQSDRQKAEYALLDELADSIADPNADKSELERLVSGAVSNVEAFENWINQQESSVRNAVLTALGATPESPATAFRWLLHFQRNPLDAVLKLMEHKSRRPSVGQNMPRMYKQHRGQKSNWSYRPAYYIRKRTPAPRYYGRKRTYAKKRISFADLLRLRRI